MISAINIKLLRQKLQRFPLVKESEWMSSFLSNRKFFWYIATSQQTTRFVLDVYSACLHIFHIYVYRATFPLLIQTSQLAAPKDCTYNLPRCLNTDGASKVPRKYCKNNVEYCLWAQYRSYQLLHNPNYCSSLVFIFLNSSNWLMLWRFEICQIFNDVTRADSHCPL